MGEVFAGRYELADPIGRGGVGAVWRAWDHRRRRYVAAKVLQQRDAHSLLRFVREQALRIDHPHVLAPASWAADDDKVLFTMDLVAGGSLVHLVGDYGPLPPAYVCTLLDQLLSGLAAVHEEGVVHRDIKPANLLLEATGTGRPRLRLSDFGIAMRLGEPRLTETNLVVGTPGYLAPEQMLGAEPDFPADLFAVGLVALYLLEGAKPDAKVLVQYFAEHGTPPAPKGIPEPLWQIVAGLLQPDPAARFRTATGARKALAAAAELLPEPDLDDELIEVFDQLGPLPPGFGPAGPLKQAPAVAKELIRGADRDDPDGYAPDGNTDKDADRDRARDRDADRGTGAGADSGRTGTGGTEPTGTGSLSDTGSFRLPPPQDLPTPAPDPHVFPHGSTRDGPRNSPRPHADPPPSPAAPPPFLPPHPQPQSPTPYPLAPWATDPFTADPSAGDPSVTASYTAREPQLPPVPQQVPQAMAGQMARTRPPGHGRRGRRARRDRRRPGPPAKAAVPILLLALVCYAVGFWALTRVV
ncbi:serine/threonine-protein kinase [Streptomyces sp. FXJ1.172]|uniref:serine/threonine-protein kinase n=1 Tax=Streptomyces sp. FXJ1.172 TaxID=710705 RepID=UPI0007CF4C94|nr:serine/threonine-protein kinase [Streptomyces sp. FXJ1.172]WEO96410.1 serine/threonine-protein kinase [Streptomyces sp. FXJ1.172]